MLTLRQPAVGAWARGWIAALSSVLMLGCIGANPSSMGLAPVQFDSGLDRIAFEMLPSGESIEVLNREGLLLLRVDRGGSELSVLDARGLPVGQISRGDTEAFRGLRWGAPDGRSRFSVKFEADGDLEVEDELGETVCKLKRRDYGFKLVDSAGETVARIRRSESGKISIRDAENLTYLTTRDEFPVEAAALLSIPDLAFAEASGLAIALWIWPSVAP